MDTAAPRSGHWPRWRLATTVFAAAAVALLAFACSKLFGFAPHDAPAATDADLEDAGRILAAQPATSPYLVYLRDKALLFDESRSALLMYAVQGRTWVALGDPVGPVERHAEVIRAFLERCQDFGGVPVFYQIGRAHLHRYADFGLTFVKIGEEAQVDLTRFSLAGPAGARYRQAIRRLERDGGVFQIVEPPQVAAIIDQLREVSDDWLAAKSTAEKGFSLGFFEPSYLERFPVAVITRHGRIDAFAGLWPGAERMELSVDLMRYRRDATVNAMEALLSHVMAWGAASGYQRFVLGMAPLSGFEESPVGALWNRLGGFVYAHGARVYNFQGLRAYKEKFNPVWEPRYLAYPGGLRLPLILADVAALIAGGYWSIFGRQHRPSSASSSREPGRKGVLDFKPPLPSPPVHECASSSSTPMPAPPRWPPPHQSRPRPCANVLAPQPSPSSSPHSTPRRSMW